MDAAITQAGIRTILTSKQFLAKASIERAAGDGVPRGPARRHHRARRQAAARCCERGVLPPLARLRRRYGGSAIRRHALATIIFSSGSTGVPKGVMLTHANVLANVDALAQIFPMTTDDCFIGVLPFFHSFGFTGTLWFPLLQGCGVAYPPESDGREDHRRAGRDSITASMLISTPTFCSAYLRRCTTRAVRAPEVRDRRRREAARAARDGVQASSSASPCSRATAARRWRRSSPSTGRTSMHRARPADRHEARLGRPSDSRRRREGRRSGHRRGPAHRHARACCSSRART